VILTKKKRKIKIRGKKPDPPANGRGKALTALTGISGSLSFLGGWQICHNLCLGIIALLSIIGISVVGMPLLFLTQYAIYFWLVAVLLLIPTLIMYYKNRGCISNKLIIFNIGIVIASVPFVSLPYLFVFWLLGGFLIAISAFLFLQSRFQK